MYRMGIILHYSITPRACQGKYSRIVNKRGALHKSTPSVTLRVPPPSRGRLRRNERPNTKKPPRLGWPHEHIDRIGAVWRPIGAHPDSAQPQAGLRLAGWRTGARSARLGLRKNRSSKRKKRTRLRPLTSTFSVSPRLGAPSGRIRIPPSASRRRGGEPEHAYACPAERKEWLERKKTTPIGVVFLCWSCYPDSDRRPHAYQACALPAEL